MSSAASFEPWVSAKAPAGVFAAAISLPAAPCYVFSDSGDCQSLFCAIAGGIAVKFERRIRESATQAKRAERRTNAADEHALGCAACDDEAGREHAFARTDEGAGREIDQLLSFQRRTLACIIDLRQHDSFARDGFGMEGVGTGRQRDHLHGITTARG
jgi:hypothetical protein